MAVKILKWVFNPFGRERKQLKERLKMYQEVSYNRLQQLEHVRKYCKTLQEQLEKRDSLLEESTKQVKYLRNTTRRETEVFTSRVPISKNETKNEAYQRLSEALLQEMFRKKYIELGKEENLGKDVWYASIEAFKPLNL